VAKAAKCLRGPILLGEELAGAVVEVLATVLLSSEDTDDPKISKNYTEIFTLIWQTTLKKC